MNRTFILGFTLAASLATAAPWGKLNPAKLNPFKGKKEAAASSEATGKQAAAKSEVEAAQPESGAAAQAPQAEAPKTEVKSKASKPVVAHHKTSKSAKGKQAKSEKERDYSGIYTTGTVAAIPSQTAGRLDFNDPEVMTFSYGKPSWSLAYAKIKTIEVADKQPELLMRIPKINERRRTFTLEFLGPKNDTQFITFEIPVKDSYAVLPLLEQRTGKGVSVAGAQKPGAWWGDGVWKTPRNTALWDEVNPPKTTTIAQKD